MLLRDKTAVITGNPYGIGRVAAKLFAEQGATVICLDDTDDGWTSTGHSKSPGPRFLIDVSNPDEVSAVARECERTHGQVHVLFNLAGRTIGQRFEETSIDTWDQMIKRNLTAAFICSQHFLPLMKGSGGGSIINHGSIDGALGNPGLAAYSSAKGGITSLTHVMAHDLSQYGIRVNSIATGGIRDGIGRPNDDRLVALTPAGRMGTPEDVARVALFLACDWSSYVNGTNIVVDGGRTTITQGCYAF
ncbi:Short-chain dehydrogenase [Bordetella tumbae]|uniref:SDR family NAD(P)-dependent oxidoreductase n=1 Tax=Bordetella tumbae TaxID=1649139 RepID=UPI0039EED4B8